MKKLNSTVVLAAVAMLSIGTLVSAEAAKNIDFKKIKCVVSGKPVDKEATLKIGEKKEDTVYFCCPACPGAFEKAPKKFAAKTNHQLVATGQYKQEKCPISGRDVDAEKSVKIGGVAVTFCCDGCKGKADKAEGAKQIELAFGEKAFKKGFARVKKEAVTK